MWPDNVLTERLNLRYPIFQAPMGSITTPSLAAAVSDAGGMGGLGMWGFNADDARRRIEGFRQLSSGSLNVNYPLWPDAGDLGDAAPGMRKRVQDLYDANGLGAVPVPQGSAGEVSAEHLETLTRSKPEVVSFHFGLPDAEIVSALRAVGVFVICSATTVAEARALEAGGVDAVIAQGTEAGGHRGTFTGVDISMQPGLFALLPQVVAAVSVPVIAAGSISNGRGIAAALALGASGVQVGTAFLQAEEANVSAGHRAGLESATDASTVVTDVISGRPSRFVRNRLIDALEGEAPVPFPAQMALTGPLGAGHDPQLSAVFAGQGVPQIRSMNAAELIQTLAQETTARLGELAAWTHN